MIIDTDVLIWYLKGNKSAKEIITQNSPFSISVITYMEIVQGMRNKEELRVFERFLKKWEVNTVHLNNNISIQAMFLVEDYYLSHSMQLADALLAATGIEIKEKILTANTKHYSFIPNIQLDVFRP